ncbi:MAG TPA: winged helix DNA-binding domain-containing protein [Natronosporangium sp.]
MRRISVEERRARLAVRHHLATPAADPLAAATGVVALHASDPASVFLSLHARTAPASVEAIEQALYEDRTLIRMHGMRRTLFVVPATLAPVVQAACTAGIAAQQRRRYGKLLADAGVGDETTLVEAGEATLRALAARGEATGAQLSADVPELRTKLVLNAGKRYQQTANITSWVLFLLAAEGRVVRGRPRGSWASGSYTWSPIERWLPDGFPPMPVERARAELVRSWLAAFGPGTVADLRWWTGFTAAQVKQALAVIDPVEVDLDGATGLVLPDDLDPPPAPDPWVALLPALDPTPMGWTERSWFLGDHKSVLFDRNGNIGPSIWCDGRIVGGWAQRKDGEVVYRLLEDIGSEASAAVEQAAARLTAWTQPVRVIPRFRTPLERELAGS